LFLNCRTKSCAKSEEKTSGAPSAAAQALAFAGNGFVCVEVPEVVESEQVRLGQADDEY
jgi:hypothetical protein